MSALNEALYEALLRADPAAVVTQEGETGEFTYSKPPSCFSLKKDVYAHMEKWGECYRLNCPKCGDTRGRLFVCHRWGTSVKTTNGRILFSRNLYVCHNQRCDVSDWLEMVVDDKNYSKTAMPGAIPVNAGRSFSVFLKQLDTLPEPHRSLQAPESIVVTKYLRDCRGFDPDMLEQRFLVRAALKGATYKKENGTPLEFYHPRVLIPIVQHRILVGWQARSIDPEEKRYKYLNPAGMQKTRWLYNLDQALMYPDILITEGIFNVWRIGEDSVALFGKVLHFPQMRLMQLIWGYDGLAVVCLDEDTYADDTDLNMAELLRTSQAFPRGVAVLRLRGGDPAEHTRQRMRQLKFLASRIATADQTRAAEAVLDEKDVPEHIPTSEAPEPCVPDNRPANGQSIVDLTQVPESEEGDDYVEEDSFEE